MAWPVGGAGSGGLGVGLRFLSLGVGLGGLRLLSLSVGLVGGTVMGVLQKGNLQWRFLAGQSICLY